MFFEIPEENLLAQNKFPTEYVQNITDIAIAQPAKNIAYVAMKDLHGWCTKEKASVLMDLVLLFKPKIVVEIGVFGGKSLIPMAFAVKQIRSGKVYGIDPWSASESEKGMEGVNKNWWGNLDHQQVLDHLCEQIRKNRLNDTIELIRATSAQAPAIENIDMLHIDGNHSEEASLFDVKKWVPLVRKGGIIIFDDITWGTTEKAVDLLNETCTCLIQYKDSSIWGIWIKN